MPEQGSSKTEMPPFQIEHERVDTLVDSLLGNCSELDEAEHEYETLLPTTSALTHQRLASRAHDLRTAIVSATETLDALIDSPDGSSCWYEHIQGLQDGRSNSRNSETVTSDQNSTNSLDFS